mgnify:CR=1 FL=1
MKTINYSQEDELLQEIAEATKQVEIAEVNFNNSDLDWFEIANAELTLRKEALNLVLMKAKKLMSGRVAFNRFCKISD